MSEGGWVGESLGEIGRGIIQKLMCQPRKDKIPSLPLIL